MKKIFEFITNMFVWFYLATLLVIVVGTVLIYPRILLFSLCVGVLMTIINLVSGKNKD